MENNWIEPLNDKFAFTAEEKISLFLGAYGSGKSEVAVNFAILLSRRMRYLVTEDRQQVILADLDMINPYFRSEPLRLSMQYVIDLPENNASIRLLPPDIKWSCPGNGGSVTVKSAMLSPARMLISCLVNLRPCILSPEEYQKLVAIQARLSNPNMNIVMIAGLNDSNKNQPGAK